mmetsp:Transcript_19780/g.30375  ORF Transcript_19780/g.30375 Transcript_19780/m.30375 type:complete len:84 (+) Transcript_19780:43-294(+)
MIYNRRNTNKTKGESHALERKPLVLVNNLSANQSAASFEGAVHAVYTNIRRLLVMLTSLAPATPVSSSMTNSTRSCGREYWLT